MFYENNTLSNAEILRRERQKTKNYHQAVKKAFGIIAEQQIKASKILSDLPLEKQKEAKKTLVEMLENNFVLTCLKLKKESVQPTMSSQ